MSFYGNRNEATAAALDLVKTALSSGAITLWDGHAGVGNAQGEANGQYLGALIQTLTEKLEKL